MAQANREADCVTVSDRGDLNDCAGELRPRYQHVSTQAIRLFGRGWGGRGEGILPGKLI